MGISLFPSFSSALRINEIMYDPQYDENYNEWVELYNDEDSSLDLSNYTVCGQTLVSGFVDRSGTIHNEAGLVLAPGEFALISDGGSGTEAYENYDIPSESLAVHVNAASICGRLANEGDTITLARSAETIDEVSYTGDAETGFSLEWRESSFSQSSELDGTPGRENSRGESRNDSSEEEPPRNESKDESPSSKRNKSDSERDTSAEEKRVSPPSFIPFERETASESISEEESKDRSEKIVLTSRKTETTPAREDLYMTAEERTRRAVIYSFAGFAIVLSLLIILKKV